MKLSSSLLIRLSLIVDKMGIAKELASIETDDKKELIKNVLAIVLGKLYKAEDEIYKWISEVKEISIDEAKSIDLNDLFEDFRNSEFGNKIKDFLSPAQD